MINFPVPLLGLCAYSGTGKTSLLTKLLPLLNAEGLRVAVIKHTHHEFDIDHSQKDSYKLRKAGARQTLIASRKRMAWISEFDDDREEPTLTETLAALQPATLDLVIVEGFKHESFAKIELHRPRLAHPLMFPKDNNIIAIATDGSLPIASISIPLLDLNQPKEICKFIQQKFLS